jgi:adenylate cyclase
MAETRKIAAIICADVVGYSRLASADEDRILARLRALRSDLIDPTIAVHHGRVVKRTGDGLLIEFRSVVDAVRCAVEVQNAMIERNTGVPPERRIEFRVGVHLGDVVEEADGDLMGDGVNIAARLEGIAAPGAICLSEDAYRQVRGRLDLAVTDLGPTQLKNIAEPVRAYSLQVGLPAQAKTTAAEAPRAALALPDKPSIAVLPFQNMSDDPSQEYFADGMVEDIITGLSRIKWLFVIARNSSFVYKGKAVDIRQVGRELGVRYVLEGGVRKAGNRLRITGQLIEAETGAHIWADRYDGALEDVFDLQDKITTAIVGILEPNIQRAEVERARRKRPDNLDAYDLFLRALPHFASVMPEDAKIGMAFLERALALDPHYAPAHAYMAWGLEMRVTRGMAGKTDLAEAVRHARAALTHGGDDAATLAAASNILMILGRDADAALAGSARALSVNGSCATALYTGAQIQAYIGDAAKAEDYARQALRLSPRDPFNFVAYIALAYVRLRERRYDEAAAFYASGVQANPRFSLLHFFQCFALALAGRDDEARAAAQRLLELEPNFAFGPLTDIVRMYVDGPELAKLCAIALRRIGLPE